MVFCCVPHGIVLVPITRLRRRQLYCLNCLQGPLVAAALLAACAVMVYRRLSKQVYLLDFSCYRPADEYQVTWKRFMAGSRECGVSMLTQSSCQLCLDWGTANLCGMQYIYRKHQECSSRVYRAA